VSESQLRERLRAQRPPEEAEAQERSWRVVHAAFEERRPLARPSRLRRLGVAAAAGAAVIALAVTPAGAEIGDAIDRVFSASPKPEREVVAMPTAGRLLVDSPDGVWVVQRDASKRLLGRYEESSWSPRGLFVVATRGHDVVALEPGGKVRWSVTAPARARDPRWAPSGVRIAYRSGPTLRVVAGDGTADRQLVARVAPAAPAWRPGPGYVLAAADRRGRVFAVDADSGDRLWRSRPGETPRQLAWSGDGRFLLALSPGVLRVFGARGRLVFSVTGGERAAFAHRGHRFAVARRGRVELEDADHPSRGARPLLRGAGPFSDLEWSPDGRWLLVGWPGADQWVLIRTARLDRLVSVTGVTDRFDPGGLGAGDFPRVSGWCCAP
jgi:hypothetical protein